MWFLANKLGWTEHFGAFRKPDQFLQKASLDWETTTFEYDDHLKNEIYETQRRTRWKDDSI